MKDLKWPIVVLAVSVLIPLIVVLGWLSYEGKDATTLLSGTLLILSALGFGHLISKQNDIQETTATIKEQTNGRISQLTSMVAQQQRDQIAANDRHRMDMKEMADKMAMMIPAAMEPPVSGGGGYTSKEPGDSSNL